MTGRWCVVWLVVIMLMSVTSVAMAEGEAVIVEEDMVGVAWEDTDPITHTSNPNQIVVTAGGDTTIGTTASQRKAGTNFDTIVAELGYAWPFSGLTEYLANDDLTLVNFEGVLTESTDELDKPFNFKGPASYTDILTLGGVDAVNLANNHTQDFGKAGFEDTKAALDIAGIPYCAPGAPVVVEVNGVKVGLIGNTFPYKDSKRDIRPAVKSLREKGCAIVIASFHWGSEYEQAFSAEQRLIGRAAIDAGADVVIGHHPHIVQGIELYKGRYILYSLGNLVFGGNVDPTDRDAYLARLTFTLSDGKASPQELTIIPIRLTELESGSDYRPVPAIGEEAVRIRDRILKRSYKLNALTIYE